MTFADIVTEAVAETQDSNGSVQTDDLAAAILADPRFAELLAGALLSVDRLIAAAYPEQAADLLAHEQMAGRAEYAAAIIRSLGAQR